MICKSSKYKKKLKNRGSVPNFRNTSSSEFSGYHPNFQGPAFYFEPSTFLRPSSSSDEPAIDLSSFNFCLSSQSPR